MMRTLLVLLLLAGCDDGGGDEEGGDGGGPGGADELTPREYFDEYARARCERDQRCGRAMEASVDACLQVYEAAAEPKRTRFANAAQLGTVAYDADKAAACIELTEGRCGEDDVTTILPTCNSVLTGTLTVGEACFAHAQCSEDGGAAGLCFAECAGLFGDEDPQGAGQCVERSPIALGDCP